MPEHTGSIVGEMPPSCPKCGGWNHNIQSIPIFGVTWKWYCPDCDNLWKTIDSGESAEVYCVPSSDVFHESKFCPGSKANTNKRRLTDVVSNRRPCGNCVGRILNKLYEHKNNKTC